LLEKDKLALEREKFEYKKSELDLEVYNNDARMILIDKKTGQSWRHFLNDGGSEGWLSLDYYDRKKKK